MSRPAKLLRRLELVEICRAPAPTTYDHAPKNRAQRRKLQKVMKSAQRGAPRK